MGLYISLLHLLFDAALVEIREPVYWEIIQVLGKALGE